MFKEIPLELIDDNPFLTRKEFDKEAINGIMATVSDDLGLRYPPLVRIWKERYQIASGHRRVKAFRALKRKSILCRVEPLTDAQMKKEVLVENVNQSDFTEDDFWLAIEQYREELGLSKDEKGFLNELSRTTGISAAKLFSLYDVRNIRNIINSSNIQFTESPSAEYIRETIGLDDIDRVKLLKKAQDRGWNIDFMRKVKQVLQKLDPEAKDVVLGERSTLSQTVIQAVGEIEKTRSQKRVIEYIEKYKLNEKLALEEVQSIIENDPTRARVFEEVIDILFDFILVQNQVMTWGVNQQNVLGEKGWSKVIPIFNKIEKQMQMLKQLRLDNS
jgi:ParB family chromosome partitioning protein